MWSALLLKNPINYVQNAVNRICVYKHGGNDRDSPSFRDDEWIWQGWRVHTLKSSYTVG